MAMPNPAALNGPPPSPMIDPAAAQESNPMRTLVGPQAAQMQQGPDVSGLLMLGQKLSEGLLTLAQAVPEIADDINQCDGILKNALARVLETQAGTGTSSSTPIGGAPTSPPPGSVTQAGVQFPGGGFGQGRIA